jgi:hypothetical protein
LKRLGAWQTMLGFSRNEDHIARPNGAHAFFGFHRPVAFHDEVKVLANLVIMIRRRAVCLVLHHSRQHVVDVCQFLIHEKGALAAGNHRDQLG